MNYTNEFPKNGDGLAEFLKNLFPTYNREMKCCTDYPFWCPYTFDKLNNPGDCSGYRQILV